MKMRRSIVVLCILFYSNLPAQKINLISSESNNIGEKVGILIDGLQPSVHYILKSTITDEWKRILIAEISFTSNATRIFDPLLLISGKKTKYGPPLSCRKSSPNDWY